MKKLYIEKELKYVPEHLKAKASEIVDLYNADVNLLEDSTNFLRSFLREYHGSVAVGERANIIFAKAFMVTGCKRDDFYLPGSADLDIHINVRILVRGLAMHEVSYRYSDIYPLHRWETCIDKCKHTDYLIA